MNRGGGRPGLARRAWLAAIVGGLSCSSGPTSVTLPPLEVLVASGDGQYGTVNQTLQTPLHAFVQTITTELPQRGANVVWTVVGGDATVLAPTTTVTDSTGSARATVRLGSSTGEVVVRASIQGQERASAEFHLYTVDQPRLDAIEPTTADPGATVTLTGANFSPDAEQNVVLFSGMRGRVTAATSTQLSVMVPTCLTARPVSVRVQLGTVGSGTRTLTVASGGEVRTLQVGETFDTSDAAGYPCVTVPGDGSRRYLVAVHSAATVGAAAHPFELRGLAATSGPLAGAEVVVPGPSMGRDGPGAVQTSWDLHLRAVEASMTEGASRAAAPQGGGPGPATAPAAAPPAVGTRRTFQVYRSTGNFVQVSAVARHVGARAALFVDEAAPGGGYSLADLQYFSDLFDDLIHPPVTGTFGSTSDLDGNERIVILFTPAVNALTPRGATGFIAGFFFGLDLLPDQTGSNGGEVFYALVPDPTGQHSDPRPRDKLLEVTPAVLAHEFQHMVNFNERVLVRGAEANEAVWLSEALAQYAEELVARATESGGGSAAEIELFRDGIRDRSRRYLERTDSVSLVIAAGSGNLPERGAGFLYLAYLADRFAGDLVGRLTRTTRTGVTNVEAETGTEWPVLLSDWWSAVYLDGPGPESGPLVYPTVDLRAFLGNPYPLVPADPGAGDFTRSGTLRSSAVQYYIVTPAAGGSATLRIGGEAGGVSAPQARLRMRIIRVQ